MTEHAWFVDAWAVHDGKLFASFRPPDVEPEYWLEAESTVFFAVPDLQPIPVGRIATAMRATRSGFQDRLRGADGAEIPFTGLDQIRELVRRGYLGGGLGPGAAGALGGPLPPPVLGPGPGTALLQEMGDADEPWSPGDGAIPDEPPAGLDDAVVDQMTAVLLEWDELLGAGDPQVRRAFHQLLLLALRHGVVRGGLSGAHHHLLESARLWHAPAVVEEVERSWQALDDVYWRGGLALWDAAPWSFDRPARGLLDVCPLPRPRHDHRLRRLTEPHTLAVVDRRRWSRPVSVRELASSVLVPWLRGRPERGRLPGEESPASRVFRAMRPSLDRIDLPEAAEVALEDFYDRCLDGDPDADPDGDATRGATL